MTHRNFKRKNNTTPQERTAEPIKLITIAEFCKVKKIKIQNFTHEDYVSFWYYCKANNLSGFATESNDIDDSYIQLRKIIDRIQELLIF